MMPFSQASVPPNFIATFCPPDPKKNEAENMLKTKGRKKGFPKNEAENIL
jgi:hypothetical protein